MNPHNPQLFILIVHYGDVETTHRAVASLTHGTVQPTKIVVVDHGQQALAPLSFPRVVVVRPSSGGGYAGGINFGLGALISMNAQATDIVVAMNNDVEAYPDTLDNLLAWWKTTTSPGLVGGKVEERGVVVHGGGCINYWTGRAQLRTTYPLQPTPCPLDYIHGAFIAAPYQQWLTLQGLPGHYYLYWEDVLLGRRARQLGMPLHYVSSVRLKHHTLKNVSLNQHYYLIRNGALFMQQETPIPWRWWWHVYNRLRYVYHTLHPAPSHRLPAQALKDALVGKAGPIKPLPV